MQTSRAILTDTVILSVLAWMVTGLLTCCLALLVYVWRRMERQWGGIAARLEHLDVCVDRRFSAWEDRRVTLVERLASVETHQKNIWREVERLADVVERAYGRPDSGN